MWNRKARPVPAVFATIAAIGTLLWAAQIVACSTDAVGIEACRSIETERCKLAPTCAGEKGRPKIKTTAQVTNCMNYYHDHCLVGLENEAQGDPSKESVNACVAAIQKTVACQKSGLTTMAACALVDAGAAVDDSTLSPCAVFDAPEHLTACRFVEKAGTTVATTAAATTGSGGAGGSGGSGG